MKSILIACVVVLSLLSGCERSTESGKAEPAGKASAPAPLSASPLLSTPLEPTLVELANGALPVWRRFAPNRPALVILCNTPYLHFIPEVRKEAARKLLAGASDEELARQTDFLNPDPVMFPGMALRAALKAGYFSQVLWVFPAKVDVASLNLDSFRNQLIEAGLANRAEAESFSLEGGVFRGMFLDTPFMAAHPLALPKLEQPVLLHIDIDYFRPIYKGEIKTPLYPLIVQTLASLKDQQWQVAAATLSRSNLDGTSPLTSRFLAGDIAAILRAPEILVQPMPFQWEMRSQALYLENFIQKEKIREILLEMEKAEPQDPSVKYALYLFFRNDRQPDLALDYLHQAVRLDRFYGSEYLALADLAMTNGNPGKSVEMLTLARQALPEDPLIPVEIARAFMNQGKFLEAKPLVRELSQTRWSSIYYEDIIEAIKSWQDYLENQ